MKSNVKSEKDTAKGQCPPSKDQKKPRRSQLLDYGPIFAIWL